jgi:hypothetical protein
MTADPEYSFVSTRGGIGGTYGRGGTVLIDQTTQSGNKEGTALAIYSRQAPGSRASLAGFYSRVYATGAPGDDPAFGVNQTHFGGAIDIQKFHSAHITALEINWQNYSGIDGDRDYYSGGKNIGAGLAVVSAGRESRKQTVGILLASQGAQKSACYTGIHIAAAAVVHGQAVNQIVVTSGGEGYTRATVTVGPPSAPGTAATARAVVSDGRVTGIVLEESGSNYDSAPPVRIDGDGHGAEASAVMFHCAAIRSEGRYPSLRTANNQFLQWGNADGSEPVNVMRLTGANDVQINSLGAHLFTRRGAVVGGISGRNLFVGPTISSGGAVGALCLANAAAPPYAAPSGGGVEYVKDGALYYIGSAGTVTLLARA